MNFSDLQWHMRTALAQARLAYRNDEVPVGAVVLNAHGEIISKAHNEKEECFNPVGHAEILAIQRAAQKNKEWRLTGCTVVVTLEPCPMCLAAMVQARVAACVFGAYDKKGGALSLGHYLHRDNRLNHQYKTIGGVLHWECSNILSNYFREKRASYKSRVR